MSIPKYAFTRGVAILPALVLIAALGSVLVGVDGFKSMSKYGQTAAAAASGATSAGGTTSAAPKQEETPGGTEKNPVPCDQKADPNAPKVGDGVAGVGKKCVRGCVYHVTPPKKTGEKAQVVTVPEAGAVSTNNDTECVVRLCNSQGIDCHAVDKSNFSKVAQDIQKYNAEATAEKLANAEDPKSILDEYKSSGGDQKALTDALNAKKESIQTEIGDYVSSDEELRNKTKAELEEMVRIQDNLDKQSKNIDKALALNKDLNDPSKSGNITDPNANRDPNNRNPYSGEQRDPYSGARQRDPNAANPNRQPNTFGGQQGGGQSGGGGGQQQQQQQRTPYQSTPQKQTQTTACPTDQSQYNQIVSNWQQQWSSYNSQYNSCRSNLSSGAYIDCGQIMAPPDQPCVPSTQNQCQQLAIAQQQQPSSSLCSGTWVPKKSGECIVGWTCSTNGTDGGDTTKPTASLICGKQIVDSESTFPLTFKCTNSTASEGIGFSTKNATSGIHMASVGTPPAGTDLATYSLKCTNTQGVTAGDTCSVQINRITSPIWKMIPGQTVKSGTSVTVGWITGGTNACVISSPDLPDFTEANKNNPSANGGAELPVLTNTGSNPKNITLKLNCSTKGGGTREWSTTIRVLP